LHETKLCLKNSARFNRVKLNCINSAEAKEIQISLPQNKIKSKANKQIELHAPVLFPAKSGYLGEYFLQ